MGGRAADVDADGTQLDRILLPDRPGDRVAISLGHLVMLVLELEVMHIGVRCFQMAGPIDRGVLMTPVKRSAGRARIAGSSKMSRIWDSTPVSAIASSHFR